MARLLVCRSCGTMNRMRDYEGSPEYDAELIEVIRVHLERSPRGNRPEDHPAQLFRVTDEEAALLDVESELVKALSDEQVFIKDTRDDMKVEALKCFNRHGRPSDGCIDWEDESKVIGRKHGIPADKRAYLCHYCPVASQVAFVERKKMGMYGKKGS